MTVPITLQNVTTFQNDTTAATTVNNNSAAIATALGNSLDTAGDQMLGTLDLNSNRIINLPAPASATEPLRQADLVAGTVQYTGGTNITVAGTTISTVAAPTFATSVTTPQVKNSTGVVTIPTTGTVTIPAATDTLVGRATTDTLTNKTLTAPVISTITNTGILTLPTGPNTLIGKATTDILTNKTIDTAGTGNHIQISGNDITRGQIIGTATNDNAATGFIGEFQTSSLAGVTFSSGNGANAAAITLSAGDWDVWGTVFLTNAGTTTYSNIGVSVSTANSTLQDPQFQTYVTVAGATYNINAPIKRVSLSTSTTIFLVTFNTFSGGSPTATGNIYARRVR